jgi:hypothetical protein
MIRSCNKHTSLPIITLSCHRTIKIFRLRQGFVGRVVATSHRELPRPAPPFFLTIKLPASSNHQAHEVNIYNTHAPWQSRDKSQPLRPVTAGLRPTPYLLHRHILSFLDFSCFPSENNRQFFANKLISAIRHEESCENQEQLRCCNWIQFSTMPILGTHTKA